ncbi:MAG: nuclear transport factor 2 family protein [Flavobacteriales bacterium]|nr:nuclear transport factor 2 family protein [Flavobacteriales bacterium]
MKLIVATLLVTGSISACTTSGTTDEVGQEVDHPSKTSTTMSKKETVGAFLGAVAKQDTTTMRALANADYIQHNPFVPTGLEPFIQLLPVLKESGTYAENVRMFEDGNYVFMHNIWKNAKPFGADEMVAFDIIRVDEHGKVAEHWDAMTVLVNETASGRSQTDGPTSVEDLERTEANKALAVSLIEDVLMGKDPSKITEYISADNYAQHNPHTKDGLGGIVEAIETLTAQNNMFKYTKLHKVLGAGNFVLTVSEGEWGGRSHAFHDLFRMKDGKIVEHWDVIQAIPTEGLANANGMFGF